MAGGVIRGKEFNITKNLNEYEKNLGVDLKITKEGDLEISNLKDFKLIAGAENAGQAIFIKMGIEPGGLIYHPAIGANLQIGEKTKNPFEIRAAILKSLSTDPRFTNNQVRVTIDGNTVIIDLQTTLINTGVSVPLKFAVQR